MKFGMVLDIGMGSSEIIANKMTLTYFCRFAQKTKWPPLKVVHIRVRLSLQIKNLSKGTIYSNFGAKNRYFILIYHLDVILKVKYCFQGHLGQNCEPTSNLKLNPLIVFPAFCLLF